jgi:hypothetical protein
VVAAVHGGVDTNMRSPYHVEHMFAKLLGLLLIATLAAAVVARQSAGGGRESAYVVKPTDTLWSIAASHYAGDPRAGVWKLERRNHLHGDLLRVGERLVLPP